MTGGRAGDAQGATRLDRLLSNLGYGSRREVARLVASGRAVLDGVVLRSADGKIDRGDAPRLLVGGEPLDPLPGLVLMLHKPTGMTCSRDEAGPLGRGPAPRTLAAARPAAVTGPAA